MGEGTIATAGSSVFRHGAEHVAQLDRIFAEGDRAASGLLATYGNYFQVQVGAESFIPQLADDILGAERQVNLTFYGWHPGTPGSWADQVKSAAIVAADDHQVPTTAIVDQVGTGLLIPGAKKRARLELIEELRDHHVDVLVKPLTFGRGGVDDARFAVDHRKIAEIDGWINHQGGMNIVDQWLTWHDAMVRTEGPASAQAGAVLAGRWRDLGGTVSEQRAAILRDAIRRPVDDVSHATELLTNGNRHRRELTDAFIAEAEQVARADEPSRLWLANPYLSDPRAIAPVVDAARAGHDVLLTLSPKVTGGGQMQDVFTDPLRRAWAWEIANAGGTVVVVPEFSHAKVWLSQVGRARPRASVTAFNLDLGSTVRNYENGVRSTDPGMVLPVESMFLQQRSRGAVATSDVVAGWGNIAAWRRRLDLKY